TMRSHQGVILSEAKDLRTGVMEVLRFAQDYPIVRTQTSESFAEVGWYSRPAMRAVLVCTPAAAARKSTTNSTLAPGARAPTVHVNRPDAGVQVTIVPVSTNSIPASGTTVNVA